MTAGPEIVTFGCRLNSYESEVMRLHAGAAGLRDAVIVNTCAVTVEAERQARQTIRRLRREKPQAKIIVTGCSAQIDPARYATMAEVDYVLGNDEKLKAETYKALNGTRVLVNDIQAVKETAAHMIAGIEGIPRAFVQVQNGCDHRCTFCIIPYGRGPSRSVPIGAVVQQVRTLVAHGINEIVLTGVDITSYGPDLPGRPTLGQMVRRLLAQIPELLRLRLSSLDPVEVDEDLWRLIADEPRLMPHLHLSLQAGDDLILKRMKRRHTQADAVAFCERARRLRPDIVFGADIIAGFPTEDDAMFGNTLRTVEACGLTWLHVFPYSPRPGTPAAKMPQVRPEVRKARAARMRELGAIMQQRHFDTLVGTRQEIFVEQPGIGRTRGYAEVRFDGVARAGQILSAEIVSRETSHLSGRLV